MGAGSDFSGLLTGIVTTRTPDRFTFPDPLRRRSLEAHRQASRVARQVIDVSCYLHQNPSKALSPSVSLPLLTDESRDERFRYVVSLTGASPRENIRTRMRPLTKS